MEIDNFDEEKSPQESRALDFYLEHRGTPLIDRLDNLILKRIPPKSIRRILKQEFDFDIPIEDLLAYEQERFKIKTSELDSLERIASEISEVKVYIKEIKDKISDKNTGFRDYISLHTVLRGYYQLLINMRTFVERYHLGSLRDRLITHIAKLAISEFLNFVPEEHRAEVVQDFTQKLKAYVQSICGNEY